MSAKIENVTDYVAGDTLVMDVTVRDPAGDLVDLTGAEATWVVAKRTGPSTLGPAYVTLSSTGGSPKITLTDAANGALRIRLEADVLTAAGEYEHQLRVDIGGDVKTVTYGRFVVRPTA